MRNFIITAVITLHTCLLLSSCNEEQEASNNPTNETATLSIRTTVAGQAATYAPVSSFSVGSQIGLFVTKGTLGNDYESNATLTNVKSSFDGTSWTNAESVRLTNQDATVYAYYPHDPRFYDGKAIPISHTGQNDYMYGTHTVGQNPINKTNPTVALTMKHALAMLEFKINKVNYPWKGDLTTIYIRNTPGKTVMISDGTMDISTGVITKISGKYEAAGIWSVIPLMQIPSIASTDVSTYPKVLVLPTNLNAGNDGDVFLRFAIDNAEYDWKIPASTQWKAGTKYTYTVTISGTQLLVGDVKITDWISEPGEAINVH